MHCIQPSTVTCHKKFVTQNLFQRSLRTNDACGADNSIAHARSHIHQLSLSATFIIDIHELARAQLLELEGDQLRRESSLGLATVPNHSVKGHDSLRLAARSSVDVGARISPLPYTSYVEQLAHPDVAASVSLAN